MLSIFCIVQQNVNSHHIVMPFLNYFWGLPLKGREVWHSGNCSRRAKSNDTQSNDTWGILVEEPRSMILEGLWLKVTEQWHSKDCGWRAKKNNTLLSCFLENICQLTHTTIQNKPEFFSFKQWCACSHNKSLNSNGETKTKINKKK